jgi:hypothetical protein
MESIANRSNYLAGNRLVQLRLVDTSTINRQIDHQMSNFLRFIEQEKHR